MKKMGDGSQSSHNSKSKAAKGGGYADRDYMSMSPEKCQEMCKPTEETPISLHKRMAGCNH